MDNIIKYLSAKGKYLLTAVLLGSTLAMSAAGGREVKGRVVDPEGNPIPGAVVNLAEQSRIVLTDQDGTSSSRMPATTMKSTPSASASSPTS